MTLNARRSFLLFASFVIAALLIVVFLKISRIDLRVTLRQLEDVRLISFVKVLLLNVVLVLISTEKWRSIDAAMRRSTDSVQPRATSFVLTSAGLALGTFLPVQFAMATARTLGTYFHGSAIKRGIAGTLYEQSFDLITVAFLAGASLITWSLNGAGTMWAVFALVMIALALATVGPAARLVCWLAASVARRAGAHGSIGPTLANFSDLLHSGLMSAALARRLVLLSVARFVVVVLMSIETAEAVSLHIPLWHMAAAIPFVVFATVVALTPGGIGINELTCAGSLKLFGTPVDVGAQWALANRVLISVSYVMVAVFSILILAGTMKKQMRKEGSALA